MKRLALFAALLAISASAFANPHYNQYQNQHRGLRPAEALILGGIGAVVVNEAYRANQPRVIVQQVPVYPQVPVYRSSDVCYSAQYFDGQYNPAAAQAYCRGQQYRNQESQRSLEIEAYNRGLTGQ